jgi:hypothetical protein
MRSQENRRTEFDCVETDLLVHTAHESLKLGGVRWQSMSRVESFVASVQHRARVSLSLSHTHTHTHCNEEKRSTVNEAEGECSKIKFSLNPKCHTWPVFWLGESLAAISRENRFFGPLYTRSHGQKNLRGPTLSIFGFLFGPQVTY